MVGDLNMWRVFVKAPSRPQGQINSCSPGDKRKLIFLEMLKGIIVKYIIESYHPLPK